MDKKYAKGAPEKTKRAASDTAGKVSRDKELRTEVKFDKPLGSSHNDEVDMRDVAREAAKKSQ